MIKSWVTQTSINIRYSYWFIPSLMAIGAIILAATLVAIDLYYLNEIPKSLQWLFSSKPEGARAILSTVAGSTITVAGVVFSMTIMSVSHATSNYGSRLLLKFLKDRYNQITLGTFTATFIYCLLVLRTVSNGGGADAVGFVPHLALLGAIVLALASVMVLIAFIHHVPDTIYIGNVAAERGQELSHRLSTVFKNHNGDANKPYDFENNSNVISSLSSHKTGYVQTLEIEGLVDFCCKHSMQLQMLKEPGDFTIKGETIAHYIREPKCDLKTPADSLLKYIGIGGERTPAQDLRFLIEELQQISIRALSPGINDPYTAITCIDWLSACVGAAMDSGARPIRHYDSDDTLRVVIPEFNFERLCNIVFNDLRPHVSCDLICTISMASLFLRLNESNNDSSNHLVLQRHQQEFFNTSLQFFKHDNDQDKIRSAFTNKP